MRIINMLLSTLASGCLIVSALSVAKVTSVHPENNPDYYDEEKTEFYINAVKTINPEMGRLVDDINKVQKESCIRGFTIPQLKFIMTNSEDYYLLLKNITLNNLYTEKPAYQKQLSAAYGKCTTHQVVDYDSYKRLLANAIENPTHENMVLHLDAQRKLIPGETGVGNAIWYKTKINGNDLYNRADFSSLQGGEPMVKVSSSTDNCKFTLGFYTQNISKTEEYLEINGRIESGECDGKKIEKGIALATAQKNKDTDLFNISETVMVIVPNGEFYY